MSTRAHPRITRSDDAATPAQEQKSVARSTPAFYRRRQKRAHEVGQLLLRNGDITPEQLRTALKIQEEQGGQLGRILLQLGACGERAIARALLDQVQVARSAGRAENVSLKARENPSIVGLNVPCRPGLTVALLLVTDILTLSAANVVGNFVTMASYASFTMRLYHHCLPTVLLAVGALAVFQLYSAVAPSPPDELRRTTEATTLVFAAMSVIAFLGQITFVLRAQAAEAAAWLLASWALSVIVVPLGRAWLRQTFAERPWWGEPVVVLGAGKTGRTLVRTLRKRPQLGLKPLVLLDDDIAKHGTLRAKWTFSDIQVESERSAEVDTDSSRSAWGHFSEVEGVPVVGSVELAPVLAHRLKIHYALVAMPGVESRKLLQLIEKVGGTFSQILVIPDLFGLASLGVPARNVGGVLGVELRQQLLLPGPRVAKRAMDVLLTVLGGIFILPILLLLALLIKIDSRGSVFYRQKRLGQDGGRFSALKFRTMYGDGEERLKEVLASDPRLRTEYEEFHKLSFDPRVTRLGRILRKYSLDELPQLYNVLRGEMSLVGPRPYLEREIPDMHQQEGIILRVMPGMTGMWQVSDRNATSFEERLKMDVDYVRNWSPWLDFYILARTVSVVVGGTGS